jgi:hypothetical protein
MRKTLKAVLGLVVLMGVVFVVGSSATPAGAQECGGYLNPCPPPIDECPFSAEYPAEVTAGGSITITGTSTDVTEIEFLINDIVIGSVTPEADGTFTGTFTVPDLAAGHYDISANVSSECGDYVSVAEDGIDVLAEQVTNPGTNTVNGGTGTTTTTTGGTPLARTGFDAAPMVTLGAAALVLGAAAVYGSKRRRTA